MPSIEDNLATWNENYDWPEEGHEWSSIWGGTDVLWGGVIWPRIRSNFPTNSLLEIAPGFGRITSYLVQNCDNYIGVDLAEKCITKCREKFKDSLGVVFLRNDGYSLPGIPDASIDFAFSFDSLVHVEADVMQAYTVELARVLRPNGAAFLHHSNVGSFMDASTETLTISNDHWRGTSMSALFMRECARDAGLHCVAQEIVNWGCPHLTDCFSLLLAQTPSGAPNTRIIENPHFMDEAMALGRTVEVFSRDST